MEALIEHFSIIAFGNKCLASLLSFFFVCDEEMKEYRQSLVHQLEHVGLLHLLLSEDVEDLSRFLFPFESNQRVLEVYVRGLGARSLKPGHPGPIYRIALHHLNGYCFGKAVAVGKIDAITGEAVADLTWKQEKMLNSVILHVEKVSTYFITY